MGDLVRRMALALAMGTALSAGGALVGPAWAAHYDPDKGQWVADCSSSPTFDGNKAVSGWDVYGGAANGSGTNYGAQSAGPYYLARVDPNAKTVQAGAWQPWEDHNPIAVVVHPPFYLDASVTVDANHPTNNPLCQKSVPPRVGP